MCGRYTLTSPTGELRKAFGFKERPNLAPRYNIAPTQNIPIVRLRPDGGPDGERELATVRWGLVPSWADDPQIGSRMINARAETVAEKPAFRAAFRKRRCLILADGFYEWQPRAGRKQPFYIRRRDHAPFAFAGLWEHWSGTKAKNGQQPAGQLPTGQSIQPPLETATIITTTANTTLQPIHDRMPVILDPADYDLWLDPAAPYQAAEMMLWPCPPDWLEAYPIGTRVNAVRHDDPACIAPLTEEGPRLF